MPNLQGETRPSTIGYEVYGTRMDETEGTRGGMSLNVDRQAVKRSATASTAQHEAGEQEEVAERALLRRRVCRKRLFDGSHARQQRQQRHRAQGGLRDVAIVGWRVLWAERRGPSLFVLHSYKTGSII